MTLKTIPELSVDRLAVGLSMAASATRHIGMAPFVTAVTVDTAMQGSGGCQIVRLRNMAGATETLRDPSGRVDVERLVSRMTTQAIGNSLTV